VFPRGPICGKQGRFELEVCVFASPLFKGLTHSLPIGLLPLSAISPTGGELSGGHSETRHPSFSLP